MGKAAIYELALPVDPNDEYQCQAGEGDQDVFKPFLPVNYFRFCCNNETKVLACLQLGKSKVTMDKLRDEMQAKGDDLHGAGTKYKEV